MDNSKKRFQFKFYRSYYDVMLELPESDRLKYLEAILHRQFTGKEIELTGMAKFAYISQKHSIDKQVEGWESKIGEALEEPIQDPMQGGSGGGSEGPTLQIQTQIQTEEEKEKNPPKKISSLKSFQSNKHQLIEECKAAHPSKDCERAFNDMLEYCQINGKSYKDYKMAFFRWVGQDRFNQYDLKTKLKQENSAPLSPLFNLNDVISTNLNKAPEER